MLEDNGPATRQQQELDDTNSQVFLRNTKTLLISLSVIFGKFDTLTRMTGTVFYKKRWIQVLYKQHLVYVVIISSDQ